MCEAKRYKSNVSSSFIVLLKQERVWLVSSTKWDCIILPAKCLGVIYITKEDKQLKLRQGMQTRKIACGRTERWVERDCIRYTLDDWQSGQESAVSWQLRNKDSQAGLQTNACWSTLPGKNWALYSVLNSWLGLSLGRRMIVCQQILRTMQRNTEH